VEQRVRVLGSADEIDRIAPEWRELAAASGPAMNTPEWYASAARFAHPASDEISVRTLWRGEQLVAVAPLALVRTSAAARYEIIGSRLLYEPAEILAADRQAAEAIAADIAALEWPALLSRLPAAAQLTDVLLTRTRRTGWMLSPGASGSPYIDLSGAWQAYHDGLPSRVRNIVRRAHRALGRLGRLEFEFTKPQPDAVPSLLQQAFEVEMQSWKGRLGSAVLQRRDMHDFFVHYALAAAARGELLIALLRLDGAPIAMQIANVGRNAYWQLKIGYDDRHSKYLPGLQLLLETIRWSFEHELDSYEFLGSREPWTREWTGQVRNHRTLLFYPFNARGMRGLLHDSWARARKRLCTRRIAPAP
jgi:CelD/BcsL family acetyltransferase involved in cellulose biosynthesis